jgi:phospholipid/cholesterol/gamma-HCH transport system permease protein
MGNMAGKCISFQKKNREVPDMETPFSLECIFCTMASPLLANSSVSDRILGAIGVYVRGKVAITLHFLTFMITLLRNSGSAFSLFHLTVERAYHIGVKSIPLIITTSIFTGAVTAWQMSYQFADMIPLTFVGMAVGKSVMIELGPLLTAMVMSGRIGASMCSELGTMAVTEQIDAMRILGLNPFKFLLAPRLVATVMMMPVLTIISMFVAILGGFAVSHFGKDVSWQMYFFGVRLFYTDWDLLMGLFKSATFGFLIASFACFFGYTTINGAEGVGRSTKATVVASMTSILITGFLISKFLLL